MTGQSHDDDIDDIMSQIIQGNSTRPEPLPQSAPAPQPIKKHRRPTHLAHPITHPAPALVMASKKPRRARHGLRKVLLVFTVVVLGSAGGFLLWLGPIQGLMYPSPFSREIKQASSIPLYYPTALPSGYEIRKDAIQPPTSGVVVYAIGNGTTQIAVTMQKKPSGLNLEPVFKLYRDLGTVETPVGTVHVGLDDTGAIIAHILTPQTWMIMNTDAKAMPRADFETILKSLKQG